MTRERRRYGCIIVAVLLLAGLSWAGWKLVTGRRNPNSIAAPASARAPEGVRIKVEVLNGTRTRGLARRATAYLRELGFDVVGSGTVTEQRATTVVFDRSSHPDWAKRVGQAMKAPVEARPDSSRYLDVTVILGADWRPPPQPFHP